MSSSVESEIVSMKFENTQFEKAASDSMSTLDKLKKALTFPANDMGKGLNNISSNVKGFNLNPLINSAGEVGRAFSAMSVIAISAIATLASEATHAALGIANSLTVAPIAQGFHEYETQIGSIQTILANTGLEGEKGLGKVNDALTKLNKYSDKTIYNFTEMAKNIGTFTAAGIDLDTSTAAIKGIANLAAVSGSNSQQASTAMYQLSQALATGTVRLMDWNSVSNAGMGGKIFKDSLMETARTHGIAIDAMIKKDGSFRDSLQEGWLSADILTETLSKFTGDLSREQLKEQGYTKKQVDEIMKLGQMANDAASKVKTLSQLMGTLKEAVGSGWAKTWSLIFGDFNQAKKSFTGLSNYFGGIIGDQAKARNKMLQTWSKLKGREVLIKAFRHAWEALMAILGPIHDAFREIFPQTTGQQLKDITVALNHFFKHLVLSKDAQENLKDTFAGLFAVIHIGLSIFKGVLHVLGTLIGLFFKSQSSTLAFTGGIGQMLVALDKFLTKGKFIEKFFDVVAMALTGLLGPLVDVKNGIIGAIAGLLTGNPQAFFDGISNAIAGLLGMVDSLSAAFATVVNKISDAMGGVGHIQGLDLAGMFGGASADEAKKGIDGVKDSLSGLSEIGVGIGNVWDHVVDAFHALGDFLSPLTSQFATVFGAIREQFGNLFSGKEINFEDILHAINTGLFLAIFIQLNRFGNAITGFSSAAQGVLKQVTSNLKTMQNEVRAAMIMQIAISLVLLAGAIFLLAQVDGKKLAASLGAISIMLIEMVTAMKLMEKKIDKGESLKLIAISTAMIGMAIALAAMAGAVFLFSLMDMEDMQKGMLGVTEAITLLTVSAAAISKSGGGANMIGAALGLTIMSAALVALSGAVKLYSKLDPEMLTNGLVKIAATIAVLALAMNLMDSGVAGAASMVIVAAALRVLAPVLRSFADLTNDEIQQALITLGASLTILALAMAAMSEGLLGAAALVVMVIGLKMLVPVLEDLAAMSWDDVKKGLEILVVSMAALVVVGLGLTVVVATFVAFGIALLLIGTGVFFAGAGILNLALALALLSKNGKAGFDILIDIIHSFLDELPKIILEFGDTLSAIAKLIGDKAPELVAAFYTFLAAFLDKVPTIAPKVGKAVSILIHTVIRVLVGMQGEMVNAGLDMLINFLNGLAGHIDRIVEAVTKLVENFLDALGKRTNRFATAGYKFLINVMNGITEAVNNNQTAFNIAALKMALAFMNALGTQIKLLKSIVHDALQTMFSEAVDNLHLPSVVGLAVDAASRKNEELTGSFKDLVGTTDQVKSALDKIGQQIKTTLDKSGAAIDKWQKKLDKLKDSGGTKKQIEHAKEMLEEAHKLHNQAEKAEEAFKRNMKKHREDLMKAAKEYTELKALIDEAGAALTKAKDEQAAFKASVMSTFGTIPDIQAGQSLASYMRQLDKQKAKIEKFKQTLAALRAAGLSDESYRQFLAEGTDAQRLMDQLLAGGGGAIENFDAQNQSLHDTAQSLADMASATLHNADGLTYDQAVDTAQKYLDGLIAGLGDKKGLKALEDAMAKIAQKMMDAIRKHLEVKSPSRKAAEVAFFFVMGLVNKMNDMNRDVEKASEKLGETALDTLQTTMSKIGDGVSSHLSMSPVITPILDLSQLARDATQISGLMDVNPLIPTVSLASARDILAGRQSASEDSAPTPTQSSAGDIIIDQHYYSPKALDPIQVYRNNKSAIALAKEALNGR